MQGPRRDDWLLIVVIGGAFLTIITLIIATAIANPSALH